MAVVNTFTGNEQTLATQLQNWAYSFASSSGPGGTSNSAAFRDYSEVVTVDPLTLNSASTGRWVFDPGAANIVKIQMYGTGSENDGLAFRIYEWRPDQLPGKPSPRWVKTLIYSGTAVVSTATLGGDYTTIRLVDTITAGVNKASSSVGVILCPSTASANVPQHIVFDNFGGRRVEVEMTTNGQSPACTTIGAMMTTI